MKRILSTLQQLFKRWYVLVLVFLVGFGVVYRLRSNVTSVVSSIVNDEPMSSFSLPQLSAVFTPEVRHWSPLIYAWASAYKVDPNLIATVIQIESCGDPLAVSRSGAQGLFQVMPFHFRAGEDMLEVLTNGRRGMEYLAKGLQIAGGDPGLALAGYNGGHGVISRGWAGWAEETRRYYQWGSGIYKDALQGSTSSATMDQWLKAGGNRLCEQASSRQAVAMK